LQANQAALRRPEVQSYLWYLLSSNGQGQLTDSAVIVFDEDVFAGYQETAIEKFTEAEATAAEAEDIEETDNESSDTNEAENNEENTNENSE
jgi:hypothetical protein